MIKVIAPSSIRSNKYSAQELLDVINQIQEYTKFQISYDSHLLSMQSDIYGSNDKDYRINEIKEALASSDSILWILQGGYGASHVLPSLMETRKPDQFKLLVGFSDTTALHIFFNTVWGWPSLHGEGIARLVGFEQNENRKHQLELLKQIFTGEVKKLEYEITPVNAIAKNVKIEGKIVGGNLCLIQTSLGTPWQLDTKNKILFIEEYMERGYAIDRMLVQLEQAGLFRDVKAVIFGDLTCTKERDGRELCENAIPRLANLIYKPIFRLKNVGHEEINNPLPFNMPAIIENGKIGISSDFFSDLETIKDEL